MSVIDIDVLIEGNTLFIVAADAKANIHILTYAPYGILLRLLFACHGDG